MEAFIVKKVLNNNVLVASHPRYEETVLIGKGIGFNRKKGRPSRRHRLKKCLC